MSYLKPCGGWCRVPRFFSKSARSCRASFLLASRNLRCSSAAAFLLRILFRLSRPPATVCAAMKSLAERFRNSFLVGLGSILRCFPASPGFKSLRAPNGSFIFPFPAIKKLLIGLILLLIAYVILMYNPSPMIWYLNERYIKGRTEIKTSPWHPDGIEVGE